MASCRFRFHGGLSDFLQPARRGTTVEYAFSVAPSVKDAIEALGVPHPEVAAVVKSGQAVSLAARLTSECEVEVYAVDALPTPPPPVRVDAAPPEPRRFVLDVHLGRLAGHLRMLGFDVVWSNDRADAELARISAAEERILLTRDVGLLKRGEVRHGYWPRSSKPWEQLTEVTRRYDLLPRSAPFTRCLRCNTALRSASLDEVAERLPSRVRRDHTEFRRCPECARVYWKGSHHARMLERISTLSWHAP